LRPAAVCACAAVSDPRSRRPRNQSPLRAPPTQGRQLGRAGPLARSPRGPAPTASSSCRRLSSWTGSRISCRRHAGTGIGITECSRPVNRPHNISTHAEPVQHWCRPTSAYVRNRYILFYISFRDLFL
jgi:hypothetical protein